jgi:disulfide bond formation protein DsbB
MVNPINSYIIPPISKQTGLLITGLISTALLGGALLFQYVGGFMPCEMCIWQRWPHLIVMICALTGLLNIRPQMMLWLIFLAGITSAGLGGYHAGVEWKFWAGPSGCTASLGLGDDISQITDQLLATPLVRCDAVVWSLFGLSMAGWNALISLDIVAVALISLRKIAR